MPDFTGVQRFSQPILVRKGHPGTQNEWKSAGLMPDKEGGWVTYDDYDELRQDLDLLLGAVQKHCEVVYGFAAAEGKHAYEPVDWSLYEVARELERKQRERGEQ